MMNRFRKVFCLLLLVMLCFAVPAPVTAEGDAPSDSVGAITAAYLTCDRSTLQVGVETVWTLHIEGAPAEAFTFDYSLGYQPGTATDANYFMHNSLSGATEPTYAFTPVEQGHYVLWVLICDRYGGTLEAQSTFLVTVDESSPEGIALMQKVDEVVALCRASGAQTEYEIALFMHDYLITHADYDETYTYYYPEGVLLYGTGVCQSYTTAYQILLEAMGMDCLMVVGYAGEDHSWNLVRIDGEWFHVDCTFDDPAGMGIENHQYFMLSDEMIALDHTWDEALYPSAVGIPEVGTPIVLTADGQPAGEYATVAAAFEAAAGLTCTELDVCITTGRTLLLPAGDWPACAERITIRGETGTAILFLQGDTVLHSALRLDNVILLHGAGVLFDIGNHRLEMTAVQFGVINLDDANMDIGLAQQLYLTGGEGSELIITGVTSALYGNLAVDTLTIDNSQFRLHGGSVTANIGTLHAVNGLLEVGINESGDSVDTTISRVCIEDGCHLFFLPTPGSKLTIHTIAPTTGHLGFHTAKLAGILNQSEDFTEMDMTIWSEYIPEHFQLMDYQYTTYSNSTNVDAYREYIPYGARLMRIPYLDPAAAEVTLTLEVIDADDRATDIAYEYLRFSVELDGEGYAVRGNDRTQSWIGDYYVLHQSDNACTIISSMPSLRNVVLPADLNGLRVTGIGSYQPYLYDQWNAWSSHKGSIVFPKKYESIVGWTHGFRLTCAVFLGEKPVFDAATVHVRVSLPVFYLTRHAASWQEDRGLPLSPSQLHAIDADHMRIVPAGGSAVTAAEASGIQAATILVAPGCLTIEDGAFAGCEAKTVFLPSTLTSIADNAFAGCTDIVFFVDQDDCYAAHWAEQHRYTVYTVDLYTALVCGLCDHVWDEGVLSSVNCAENMMTYTCTVCGMTKAITLPTDIPHEWQESGTLLRCTASQYIYRCIHCGEEWYVDMAELLPWPCTWNQRLILIQQTCTEPGEALYQCAYCTNEQRVPIPPHFWSEGTLTVLSDDGAAGEMHYVCRDCGETKVAAVTEGLPGDVNDDGLVDMIDAMILTEWCGTGLGEVNLLNCDMNSDGVADMQDVLLIQDICSGS